MTPTILRAATGAEWRVEKKNFLPGLQRESLGLLNKIFGRGNAILTTEGNMEVLSPPELQYHFNEIGDSLSSRHPKRSEPDSGLDAIRNVKLA
jgi:hypothetical protein